ncbi:hypothetical protein LSH36_137g06062 [Paralvinella palmiformis]|uniref:Aftiphilin clathrin-binding box domain-containing protein n=1 Tax=Paralvinella palmiformis TaxID=53620 RepID=A0AAD9N9E1_9ANNE|nr:hypothetical protein LSH36_137g06062 [Paralvinella palmiformis]
MSTFIPIVSSSPPPLDESVTNNNDDDDWDDFAQFTGTSDPVVEDSGKTSQFFSPIEPPDSGLQHHDNGTDAGEHRVGFEAFTDRVEADQDDSKLTRPHSVQSEHSPSSDANSNVSPFQCGLNDESVKQRGDRTECSNVNDPACDCLEVTRQDECPLSSPEYCSPSKEPSNNGHQMGCRSEAPDVASQGSATDSGLSTDISPSTKTADMDEDFAAKIEHMVGFHDSHDDSGTEDQGMASNDEHLPNSSVAKKTDDKKQLCTLSDSGSNDVPGELSSSSDGMCEAKDDLESCKGFSKTSFLSGECHKSSTSTSSKSVSCSSPAACDVSETTQCHTCLESCTLEADSLQRQDPDGDIGEQMDPANHPDQSGVLIADEQHQDVESPHPLPDVSVEYQEEFSEFKDALESQISDGENENSEPDVGGFHFKQHLTVGEDDSPVESLDLKLPATDIDTPQDEWGDDFAEFQETAQPHRTDDEDASSEWAAFGDNSSVNQVGGDWASFGDVKTAELTDNKNTSDKAPVSSCDDDDFGDFEDVPTDNFQTFVSSMTNILQNIGNINQLKKIVGNVFNNNTLGSDECMDIDVLVRYMEKMKQKPPRKDDNEATNVCVWNNLKDISNTAALKYTWNNSVNRQKLLQACAIDTRNILLGHKKPSVPIFYQQTVLEPSRGPVEPNKPPTPTVSTPECRTPDPSTSQAISQATVVSMTPSSVVSGAGTPQDIPPAEFDWSSSGLTNPLDESSNIHLDLDFFIRKDSNTGQSPVPSSKALKQEQEILQALETSSSGKPEPPKTLQTIETLLAGLKFTPTAPPSISKKVETVSREARRILDTLPDLSFMNASVLMFPLKVASDPAN